MPKHPEAKEALAAGRKALARITYDQAIKARVNKNRNALIKEAIESAQAIARTDPATAATLMTVAIDLSMDRVDQAPPPQKAPRRQPQRPQRPPQQYDHHQAARTATRLAQ